MPSFPPFPSPPLPLGPFLVVTTAKLGIIIITNTIALLPHSRRMVTTPPVVVGGARVDGNKVARVLVRILVLLDELAQLDVARVDELQGRQAALVLDARVGAGLEHHLDEGLAKGALGGGLGVEPADGGVQRRVALEAVDRVAFERGLVEEEVDDFVCFPPQAVLVCVLRVEVGEGGGKAHSCRGMRPRGRGGCPLRWWCC